MPGPDANDDRTTRGPRAGRREPRRFVIDEHRHLYGRQATIGWKPRPTGDPGQAREFLAARLQHRIAIAALRERRRKGWKSWDDVARHPLVNATPDHLRAVMRGQRPLSWDLYVALDHVLDGLVAVDG